MAERDRLLSDCRALNSTGGSNPPLPAINVEVVIAILNRIPLLPDPAIVVLPPQGGFYWIKSI